MWIASLSVTTVCSLSKLSWLTSHFVRLLHGDDPAFTLHCGKRQSHDFFVVLVFSIKRPAFTTNTYSQLTLQPLEQLADCLPMVQKRHPHIWWIVGALTRHVPLPFVHAVLACEREVRVGGLDAPPWNSLKRCCSMLTMSLTLSLVDGLD